MRALYSLVVLGLVACAGGAAAPDGAPAAGSVRKVTLAAYTTPREAYGEILPKFAEHWKSTHGEELVFEESYQGSGAQARAVVEGFEADVVALSLEPDVRNVEKAGLITSDWTAGSTGGMVSKSLVVIAVRPGNPKGIKDWADLARPDVDVLTPNVRTSGGAMWNVAALYGAALRGHVDGVAAGDSAAATEFLGTVLARVKVMDKGARESMVTFESGVGDAALTYENEVLVAQAAGKPMEYVVPRSTIVIENPVAVVDKYATKHGNLEVARALTEYLFTAETQAVFAEYGLRPVVGTPAATLPTPADAFTVRDLGGWPRIQETLFAKEAAYDQAVARSQKSGK